MLKYILGIILIGLVPLSLFGADVVFKVSGIDSDQGQVVVIMFSEEKKEDFPIERKEAICDQQTPSKKTEVNLICKDISNGKYAAFAFHDANANGNMDHNWIGFPKEQLGFSSDASASFGIPDFVDAAFSVEGENISVPVRVEHFFK